ncbi:hypothetical protein BRD06_02145 [Halobacteriales archaeon QS_9_67_15]|nr:MAG: hypothetical protein BRD06_02145 [Halobacteriales archaeon QS_9_67_15]
MPTRTTHRSAQYVRRLRTSTSGNEGGSGVGRPGSESIVRNALSADDDQTAAMVSRTCAARVPLVRWSQSPRTAQARSARPAPRPAVYSCVGSTASRSSSPSLRTLTGPPKWFGSGSASVASVP